MPTLQQQSLRAVGAVDLERGEYFSRVIATIIAASVGVGVGGTGGVGASIGAALAENFIGFDESGTTRTVPEIQPTLMDSSITAGGDLSATAIANQGIGGTRLCGLGCRSLVVASGAVGLSGSGVNAKNKIGATVQAYIEGDGATGISADRVTLTARDTSNIKADAGAVSLAASFAGVGSVSFSIGVALACKRN